MHRLIQDKLRGRTLVYPVPGKESNSVPVPSVGVQTNEREVANMRQLGPDFYDSMHAKIDPSVTRTRYDRLFRKVVANIRNHGSSSILEVGCGSGFLA